MNSSLFRGWFGVFFVVAAIAAIATTMYAFRVRQSCNGIVVLDALNLPTCVQANGVILPTGARR